MTKALVKKKTDSKADEEVSPDTDRYLRAERIVEAINNALPNGFKQLPALPPAYKFKKRDRESAAVAFHSAFELIGGVSRLQLWAEENPDKFYPLFIKAVQGPDTTTNTGTTVNVLSSIPASPLDFVNVDARGRVFTMGRNPDDGLPE